MPAEVAEVLTIRTALRGRRHRGRVFLPAFAVAEYQLNGLMSPGVASTIVAAAVVLQAAAVVTGWELGVASYGKSVSRAGVITSWAPEFQPVQSFSMDSVADVIRGRKT